MTNQQMQEMDWIEICTLDDITPNTGMGALVADQAIALFRVGDEARVYALSARDPFSQANVMRAASWGYSR
jgi:nitrite reductase (NADH) large subunit